MCRVKALASVVAAKSGVQVFRLETLKESTILVQEGEKETGRSISELLSITKAKVEGIAKDMPVVGRWRSKDGEVFYLAIGMVCGKDGKPDR